MKVLKWVLWITLAVILLLFNNFLGTELGRLGNCRLATVRSVSLYTSCSGTTAHLITNILGATAITVGDNILTVRESLPDAIMLHELAHVRQYHILGPAFLPVYGCAQLAAWVDTKIYPKHHLHDSNIMEFWADSISPSLAKK